MTNKTELEHASVARLRFLHTILADLEEDDDRSLRAFFIGALSAECDDDQWNRCVETALALLADTREHRQTCACQQSPDEPVV